MHLITPTPHSDISQIGFHGAPKGICCSKENTTRGELDRRAPDPDKEGREAAAGAAEFSAPFVQIVERWLLNAQIVRPGHRAVGDSATGSRSPG